MKTIVLRLPVCNLVNTVVPCECSLFVTVVYLEPRSLKSEEAADNKANRSTFVLEELMTLLLYLSEVSKQLHVASAIEGCWLAG